MKIRIKGNSVRFRLTQSEVKQLCEKGSVKAQTQIREATFGYEVVMDVENEQMSAEFKEGNITLFLPKKLGEGWNVNNEVGFEHQQGELYLLLEKDFTCLDNTMEDQSDNYPNPKLMTNK